MARSRLAAARVAAVGLVCLGVTACGSDNAGPGVDADCDAAAVEDEIHHIVAESTMTFEGLKSLQCSGDWSYAVAIVDNGSDTGSASVAIAPFLFFRTDDVLVLKSPQIVCGPLPTAAADAEPGSQVPDDLAAVACP